MKKFLYPTCNNSLATSCAKSVMASSCGDGKVAALFTEVVSSSAEGELAIDETASTVSLAQMFVLYPESLWLCEKARSMWESLWIIWVVKRVLYVILFWEKEVVDIKRFVDIISGITAVGDAESERWTFADRLARPNFSVGTLAEGVVNTSRLPTCESSLFIAH